MKIINNGAEAVIYEHKILNENIIIKKRNYKKYRHKILNNKIIKIRNKQEANLIKKVKSIGLNTPTIFYIGKDNIIMEKIVCDNTHENKLIEIGKNIAKLHNNNIVHGDLNLINILTKNKDIYFIDFGLGYVSNKVEDKATDLLVFKKTLLSSLKTEKYWLKIIKGYKEVGNTKVIATISNIEKRGRYL